MNMEWIFVDFTLSRRPRAWVGNASDTATVENVTLTARFWLQGAMDMARPSLVNAAYLGENSTEKKLRLCVALKCRLPKPFHRPRKVLLKGWGE